MKNGNLTASRVLAACVLGSPPWQDLLRQTAVLKLNGGLGTSMGLEKAKSLLEVGRRHLLACLQYVYYSASPLADGPGEGHVAAGGGPSPLLLLSVLLLPSTACLFA